MATLPRPADIAVLGLTLAEASESASVLTAWTIVASSVRLRYDALGIGN